MKILFLTSRIPYPPDRGDKLRTYRFLRAFAEKHEVHLCSLSGDEADDRHLDTLRQWCADVRLVRKGKYASAADALLGAATGKPAQVTYYRSSAAQRLIRQMVAATKFDMIYTHLIRMAPYACDMGVPAILDYTDAISEEYRLSIPFRANSLSKLFFIGEAKRSARYEKAILDRFDQAWFITQQDPDALGFQGDKRVRIVPNPTELFESKSDYASTGKVVFLGNLSVPHNIHAVNTMHKVIMPRVRTSHAEARFIAAGAGAGPDVRKLDGEDATSVAGFVDDLGQFMREADVMAAPLFFSAGVQNKILEAMSAGLPVVCTEKVAQAIGAENGLHLFRTDDPEKFAAYVNDLLGDEDLRRSIGQQGRRLIEEHYSQQTVSTIIDECLRDIANSDR